MSNLQLLRWLMREIHNRKLPRKSPKRSNGRGPARNWKYRQWIRSLPCAACDRTPSQAAHTGDDGGMRQKASDYSCVPLCPEHHAEYDNGLVSGHAFEESYGLDFRALVTRLNRDWFQYSDRVK
jgi:hypothetical protein